MPACALQCGECPGVNAFYCEGRGWVLSADEMNKMEFRGQYANIRCLHGRIGSRYCVFSQSSEGALIAGGSSKQRLLPVMHACVFPCQSVPWFWSDTISTRPPCTQHLGILFVSRCMQGMRGTGL